MLQRKRPFISLMAVSIMLVASTSAEAASNSDKALALVATGCKIGMFTPVDRIALGADTYSETILSALWVDPSKQTEFMEIHLTALSQGFSAAASLDAKYVPIYTKYEKLFGYLESKLTSGRNYYEIRGMGTSKYGNAIFASCNVYLTQARVKAKKSKKSLLRWIQSTGGDLLPRLDVVS